MSRVNGTTFFLQDQIDELMALHKHLILDAKFFESLTLMERAAVDLFKENKGINDSGWKHFSSASQKWQKMFFEEDGIIYKTLDIKALGFYLSKVRESRGYTKTYLADLIKYDRSTIDRVERGDILASLEYMYRFVSVFEMTVDDILDCI